MAVSLDQIAAGRMRWADLQAFWATGTPEAKRDRELWEIWRAADKAEWDKFLRETWERLGRANNTAS